MFFVVSCALGDAGHAGRRRARDITTVGIVRTARGRPPRLEVAIETPAYDLTKFKVHFGNLTLKGYTKGERVLRFEGIAHNPKDLHCGKALEKFAPIVTRSKQMVEDDEFWAPGERSSPDPSDSRAVDTTCTGLIARGLGRRRLGRSAQAPRQASDSGSS
jgi:hypothetical protein